ncbi:MAG: hypothetical protein HUU38_00455 [Anaerolineales bacterium]|nr:hypothetical protein [Anaerolineales bacterium]
MAKNVKHLDVYRVIQDQAYASQLTRAEWLEQVQLPGQTAGLAAVEAASAS